MKYEGLIYRPPSEAYSLLLQVTIGCSHNKCTFCSMFKAKNFRVRSMDEIFADLEEARSMYSRVGRIFLCDGDALCLSTEKLKTILTYINENFPECERVGVYGSPKDVLEKTKEELEELRSLGMTIIYIGAESGSDKVLKDVHKGATAAEITEAIKRIEASGIAASVTFISGLAGKDGWEEHAIATGKMISEAQPSYASLLTLMVEPGTPLFDDVRNGKFRLLSPEEVIAEEMLMLKNTDVEKTCVFRSNHASNYVSLKGNLPDDKEKMLGVLKRAMEDKGMLKDERFRAL